MPATVLAMPSTALVLDEVRAGEDGAVADLRAAVLHATAPGAASAVVVAVDPAAVAGTAVRLTPPDGVVHLGGLGLAGLHMAIAPDAPDRDEEPGGPPDAEWQLPEATVHPGPDLAVLAMVGGRAVRTGTPRGGGARGAPGDAPPARVALVGMPVLPDADLADRVTAALLPALRRDALIICAADLAAGHGPKPPRPEVGESTSTGFDQAVARAVAEGDGDAIDDLALRAPGVAARGLPALQVAVRLAGAAGMRPGRVDRTVVDGVGGLVCRWRVSAAAAGQLGVQGLDPR